MFGVTDLKKGTLIKLDGQPWKVIEYNQKQMGRGGSIVNTKIKNMLDGKVIPKTFKGADKIEAADIENRTVQYLYNDGVKAFFMDNESFVQSELDVADLEHELKFLLEGMSVDLQLFDGNPVNIELPKNLFLKVIEAPEVVKGDTSGAVTKDIIVETGYKMRAPGFIKPGDEISVDTVTGEYRERKK
ncbi:MAG: elongation factor [Patescibacteria group bacterium]|nr:elongation factor [Patescibacteria group bacterium]